MMEITFHHSVWLGTLGDWMESWVTQEELRVEPLLLHNERTKRRRLRSPGCLLEVFLACPTRRRKRNDVEMAQIIDIKLYCSVCWQ